MFNERIQKVREIIRDAGADAFLLVNHELSGQPGTRYLSGFSGSESILVITEKDVLILADGRYFSQVKKECSDFELVRVERLSFLDGLKIVCERLNLKKFYIDTARTQYSFVTRLRERIESISITGAENILQKIRIIKDETELVKIQKAVSIACEAFNNLLPHIKSGVTEKELAWKLDALMKEYGAEKISFDIIVASGQNGAKPHGTPTDKKIIDGELVTFDFGCFYEGYASDITRTVAIGAVSEKLKEIYDVVKVAQELGCKSARAGISGKALDDVCRSYISNRGYGDYFLHSTGHGLGIEVHEFPFLVSSNEELLPKNSVVTIEPGVYIDGLGGVRIEDDVILKADGNINLSKKLSKELIIR